MKRWCAPMLVLAVSLTYGCRDAPPGFGPNAPEDEVVGHWMDDGTAPKVVGMDSGARVDTTFSVVVDDSDGRVLRGLVMQTAGDDTLFAYRMDGYRAGERVAVSYHDCSLYGTMSADRYTAKRRCFGSGAETVVVLGRNSPPEAVTFSLAWENPSYSGGSYSVRLTVTNNHPTLDLLMDEATLCVDVDATFYFWDEVVGPGRSAEDATYSDSKPTGCLRGVSYVWRGTP